MCAARDVELGMNEGGGGGLGCQVGIISSFFWSLGAMEGCRARVERTAAEAETPVFWSSDVNSQLIGKVSDTGKD